MLSIHFHKVRFREDVSSTGPGNQSTWNHVIIAEYLSSNFSHASIFKIILLSQARHNLFLLGALALGVKWVDVCLYHTVTTTVARSRNLAAADSHHRCIKPNLWALLTRNYPDTSSRAALIPLLGAVLHGHPSLPSTAPPHAITLGWTDLREKLKPPF